jgi:Domain of unknown function (DUF4263)
LQYWGRSNTHQHWFAIGLQLGQKFFNVAFCSYLHLQYFNWAAVPGRRFSNSPTSQSPIVGRHFCGELHYLKTQELKMLYDRDYRILSDEEKTIWQKVEANFEKAKVKGKGMYRSSDITKYYDEIPIAALHHKQLFPNNYLNSDQLDNKEELYKIVEEFKILLDKSITEREILNFIKDRKAYFIIASILKGFHYGFGHHSAFAFKEFELPPNHFVDYLLVGQNSGGYEFVFIELENIYGQITNKDGEYGSTIRKGLKQISDWESWLEKNYSSLKLVYDKYLGTIEQLPGEFHELDKSRIHFVVIAGRRKDFNKKTYEQKRKLLKANNINLLHYDNLLDSVDFLMTADNY